MHCECITDDPLLPAPKRAGQERVYQRVLTL